MSFLPVTEALKCLESEGLVESRPRIGTRVRVPNEQDIRDSNVIREALESQAARLCAQNITVEEKKQLRTSARQLDELKRCARRNLRTHDSYSLCIPTTWNSICKLQNWVDARGCTVQLRKSRF